MTKWFTAKTRITFGLVCLLASILCTAMMVGMVPERRSAVLSGRAKVCETIAITGSDYISRGEFGRLSFLLENVVQRNDEVLSAAARKANGELVVAVGDHSQWKPPARDRSNDSQVLVPVRAGQQKWGTIELRFVPSRQTGIAGIVVAPWVRLTVFVLVVGFLVFYLYLGKMLQHLDPSKTVPKRVRTALDSLAEGLLVIDREQRIVLANQSFGHWVDREPEKLIGLRASLLDWVREEESADYPWLEALRQERAIAGVPITMACEGQSKRVLVANASPVLGHDGKYRGVLVSFNDVTQLEETKTHLQEAKLSAEVANQSKSNFLARMSHEIRTPMNAILGYTDVLRRGFDESVANRAEYLDTIHQSGEHLLDLINDILDLSKVESGQMELEVAPCSPHQVIMQTVKLLRPKANDQGILLDCRFDSLLPETMMTDSGRLRQQVMNLVSNAVKFTEQGEVIVSARIEQQPRPGLPCQQERLYPQLVIDVNDTGIGIPAEAQAKIFEPFAQADTSVTRKFGGTGLGLAICKQLAEAMGGGVGLKSELGKGSKFTISIAAGDLTDANLVDETVTLANERHQTVRKDVVKLPPCRVLVADDGESNRRLIALVLRRAGAEVFAVDNGKEALDYASRESVDAILMDMQMPVMDGYTATRALRRNGCELPIIALTAHAMRGDEEKCLAAGCSGFLAKPIEIDHLLATLAEALGGALIEEEHPISADEDGRVDSTAAVGNPWPNVCSGNGPIPCSYPLDDPDFVEIALEFKEKLADVLTEMFEGIREHDHELVGRHAHWLKGSGGTAGFDAFTEPAHELQLAADAQRAELYSPLFAKIVDLAQRIEIHQPAEA